MLFQILPLLAQSVLPSPDVTSRVADVLPLTDYLIMNMIIEALRWGLLAVISVAICVLAMDAVVAWTRDRVLQRAISNALAQQTQPPTLAEDERAALAARINEGWGTATTESDQALVGSQPLLNRRWWTSSLPATLSVGIPLLIFGSIFYDQGWATPQRERAALVATLLMDTTTRAELTPRIDGDDAPRTVRLTSRSQIVRIDTLRLGPRSVPDTLLMEEKTILLPLPVVQQLFTALADVPGIANGAATRAVAQLADR